MRTGKVPVHWLLALANIGQGGAGLAGIEAVWLQLRHCHVLRNEMAHFCTDLQTYIMFEVLETAWQAFLAQLQVSTLL